MSKTSRVDPDSIRTFFERICTAAGWENPRSVERGTSEFYTAEKRFPVFRRGIATLELRLYLKLVEDSYLVLENIYFSAHGQAEDAVNLMPPQLFLDYWGKKLYPINPSIEKPPTNELWAISAPKDLDAFFEGYDRLAKRLGFMTLFEN